MTTLNDLRARLAESTDPIIANALRAEIKRQEKAASKALVVRTIEVKKDRWSKEPGVVWSSTDLARYADVTVHQEARYGGSKEWTVDIKLSADSLTISPNGERVALGHNGSSKPEYRDASCLRYRFKTEAEAQANARKQIADKIESLNGSIRDGIRVLIGLRALADSWDGQGGTFPLPERGEAAMIDAVRGLSSAAKETV